MLQVFWVGVLDSKIVNDKGKGNITGAVEEESFRPFGFDVSMLFEVADKVVMGNFSCLFQSIPGTVDLGVNVFRMD